MLTHHPHGAQAVDELVQPPLLPTYRVLQIRPLLRTLKQEGGGREYWGRGGSAAQGPPDQLSAPHSEAGGGRWEGAS